ncbi:MAG: hypothetical protein QOJ57_314, partial [Thermoleophilaceae bacterium]|nr:hypothetical protein [Thermoleophilaceae bacterium]
AKLRGRQYALAGSYRNGLQIVDIKRPTKARVVSTYDCGVTQGDMQVFRQADEPGRTFATYTSDTFGDGTSTCYREAAALGFDVLKANGTGKNGTFIVDISDPRAPKTVSFTEIAQGSHNQSVHPSGNYLYNSNSDLITSLSPAIEITDISNPAAPRAAGELPLPTRPGLGTESHDISFNRSGTRAYSAALSQGVIIDTTDPGKPEIVTSFLDPSINVWHEAEPFKLADSRGNVQEFLIVEDEAAGAVGTAQCPNGGVHVYDITGENERAPVKVGYWNIDDVGPTADPENSCTAHVFDIHEKAKRMTIAYYNGGVRVVDISGLMGITLGETSVSGRGMKEIGYYRTDNANTWSAKTPWVNPRTGDFYLYGNDMNRGLDIYRFSAAGGASVKAGSWLTPAQAKARALARPRTSAGIETSVICLLAR